MDCSTYTPKIIDAFDHPHIPKLNIAYPKVSESLPTDFKCSIHDSPPPTDIEFVDFS